MGVVAHTRPAILALRRLKIWLQVWDQPGTTSRDLPQGFGQVIEWMGGAAVVRADFLFGLGPDGGGGGTHWWCVLERSVSFPSFSLLSSSWLPLCEQLSSPVALHCHVCNSSSGEGQECSQTGGSGFAEGWGVLSPQVESSCPLNSRFIFLLG